MQPLDLKVAAHVLWLHNTHHWHQRIVGPIVGGFHP